MTSMCQRGKSIWGHELDDCAAKMYRNITVVILSDNMLICFQLIESHVCFLYLFSIKSELVHD